MLEQVKATLGITGNHQDATINGYIEEVKAFLQAGGISESDLTSGQPKNLFFGSFKTYGGTEKVVNGLYSIENTAVVEGWYRPDLKADCRVGLVNKGKVYEVYVDIEDIEERHQFMKFKLKYLSGGV